ncbi:uncharacterized protein L203_103123 [Cryptococcus depauperatus CBS 7841]|uniref:Uncharacterized protein n=1 Tax=Cryptococcus depauperatus CBS 7841 TaxID=1295531 RepID=A0A1E3IPG6_9TREE|nr:hypothetical protein L203_01603 [Cryptococcus depauperatus CBS 7841]
MSLSSSTLSLKFMQRGSASSGISTSTTTKTTRPSTSASTAGPSTAPVAVAGYTPNSIDKPKEVSKALVAEEQAKWFITRAPKTVQQRNPQFVFEASYTSFLPGFGDQTFNNHSEDDDKNEERQAGGGRMAFGEFGRKGKEKTKDDGKESNEGNDIYNKRSHKSRLSKNTDETGDKDALKGGKSQTFMRPAISPPPAQPEPTSNRPIHRSALPLAKQETGVSSKAAQVSKGQKRLPSESLAKSTGDDGGLSKRVKLGSDSNTFSNEEISVTGNSGLKKVSGHRNGGEGKTLDERQRILKAQKKAEKRAQKTANNV